MITLSDDGEIILQKIANLSNLDQAKITPITQANSKQIKNTLPSGSHFHTLELTKNENWLFSGSGGPVILCMITPVFQLVTSLYFEITCILFDNKNSNIIYIGTHSGNIRVCDVQSNRIIFSPVVTSQSRILGIAMQDNLFASISQEGYFFLHFIFDFFFKFLSHWNFINCFIS